MLQVTWFADAGHAWLAVPKKTLVALGIAEQISSYSYIRDDIAFLEEDCDAGKFMEAAANTPGFTITVNHAPHEDDSIIRTYARYPR